MLMRQKLLVAKEDLKVAYDKGAREGQFAVGDMVLLRLPGFAGKLEDAWDGPYEINRKFNEVNYEFCIPSRLSKVKVVHVNNIKKWVEQKARVLRIYSSSN